MHFADSSADINTSIAQTYGVKTPTAANQPAPDDCERAGWVQLD
jgi:hypothetical protein